MTGTNKNLPSQMGREALAHPVVPPKLTVLRLGTIHFVPTNIGLSYNVEKTAQTTKRGTWNMTPDTLFTCTAREGTSTGFGRVQLSASSTLHISGGLCRSTFLCHCL